MQPSFHIPSMQIIFKFCLEVFHVINEVLMHVASFEVMKQQFAKRCKAHDSKTRNVLSHCRSDKRIAEWKLPWFLQVNRRRFEAKACQT
jgi:hypothetical protein